MTLIQTLVAPEHILQVSDRRLTYPDGSIADNSYNKAVSWCNELVIAFTGIAYIDPGQRKPVSEWIAETLSGVSGDGEEAIEKLRSSAERAVKRLPWPDKRLTIVISGFVDDARVGRHSVTFTISNFEADGQTFPQHQPAFIRTLNFHPDEPDRIDYFTSGATLTIDQRRIARKRILNAVKRGADWNDVAKRMISLQRVVSRGNRTVGRDAMVISLPKNSSSPGLMLTDSSSSELNLGAAGFSYVDAGGFSPRRFGPHFVCGETAYVSYETGSIGPEGGGGPFGRVSGASSTRRLSGFTRFLTRPAVSRL
ncbi:hypothetical protein [Nocardia wallacei]|uniref:hypothetical protein n=1 Tax=Nocardia wallacei TaxID=480035 RepID=UPI002454537D|nr:hypothetical protein [Nocardia wallacei]